MSTGVDDETILEVLRANDDARPSTTEVADQLPITRGRTRTRLQQLVEDDKLERAREGNSVVWWLPEREDEIEAADAEEADAEEADEPAETEEEKAERKEEPDEEPVEAEEEEPVEAEEEEPVEAEEEEPVEAEGEEPVETEKKETADEETEEEPPLADAQEATDAESGTGETDLVDGPTADEVGEEIAESMSEGADVEGGEAAGPSAGDGDVIVESVESLDEESPGRTPDAETETRPAAERPPELSRDEGLRRLAMVAVTLVAILLLRKLLRRADGPDER